MSVESLRVSVNKLAEALTVEIAQIQEALESKSGEVPTTGEVDLSAEIAMLDSLTETIKGIIPDVVEPEIEDIPDVEPPVEPPVEPGNSEFPTVPAG